MTATVPQQGPPVQGGPTLVRRTRSVYGIPIRDLTDGRPHIDYVGKTIRPVAVREAEHRGEGRNPEDEQPWSDLIVGNAVVLESDEHLPDDGKWSDAKLAEREQWWIRNLQPHRPRYNWEFNADCPGQIPKWVAAEQRAERDRARGVVSRWTNPELFARPAASVPVLPRPETSRPVPRRSFWRWLAATPVARSAKRGLRRIAPWLVVAGVVWVALLFQHVPASDAAPLAGIASGLAWAACRWLRNGWRDWTKPKARTRRANTRRRNR